MDNKGRMGDDAIVSLIAILAVLTFACVLLSQVYFTGKRNAFIKAGYEYRYNAELRAIEWVKPSK